MSKNSVRLIEQLESSVIPLIQQEGADRQVTEFWPRVLLGALKCISHLYGVTVWLRLRFFQWGVLRRWPLGVQEQEKRLLLKFSHVNLCGRVERPPFCRVGIAEKKNRFYNVCFQQETNRHS